MVKQRARGARELFLFGVVGGLNTLASYAVYAGGLYVGLSYPWASVLSMVASICIGFKAQGRFVFLNTDARRVLRYIAMWCVLMLVYLTVVTLSVRFGVSEYIGGLLAIPPVMVVSYLAQKYFVFKR